VALTSLNLDLGYNSVGSNGVKYLGEEISKSVTLSSLHLDLRCNGICVRGAKSLGEGISWCVNLTSLHLIIMSNTIRDKKVVNKIVIKAKRLIKYYTFV